MKPQSTPATPTPPRAEPRSTDGADDAPLSDITPPEAGALIQHPDGWYWLADSGRQQFGPYASADEALAEMMAAGEESIEPDESLSEVEQELGISDWLDPDTGSPAEDMHTRLEDH